MAESKTKKTEEADKTSQEYWNEKVKYKAYKNPQRKDDIKVIVNGKCWMIQRGVEVEIPRFVLEVIKESEKQDEVTAEMIESESDYLMGISAQGKI